MPLVGEGILDACATAIPAGSEQIVLLSSEVTLQFITKQNQIWHTLVPGKRLSLCLNEPN